MKLLPFHAHSVGTYVLAVLLTNSSCEAETPQETSGSGNAQATQHTDTANLDDTPNAARQTGEGRAVPSTTSAGRALLTEASQVLEKMRGDAELAGLLRSARGVFLAPSYAPSRHGVLISRQQSGWGLPEFVEVEGIAVAPRGYESDVAILLLSDAALALFEGGVSPHEAELKLMDYVGLRTLGMSRAAEQDLLFWAEDDDVFTGIDLGLTGIARDTAMNARYYGRRDSAGSQDRVDGPEAALQRALSPH